LKFKNKPLVNKYNQQVQTTIWTLKIIIF